MTSKFTKPFIPVSWGWGTFLSRGGINDPHTGSSSYSAWRFHTLQSKNMLSSGCCYCAGLGEGEEGSFLKHLQLACYSAGMSLPKWKMVVCRGGCLGLWMGSRRCLPPCVRWCQRGNGPKETFSTSLSNVVVEGVVLLCIITEFWGLTILIMEIKLAWCWFKPDAFCPDFGPCASTLSQWVPKCTLVCLKKYISQGR